MKVTYFDELSLSKKALIMREFGVFIHSVESQNHKILLYALDHYFVEAYYNFDSNEIEEIRVADYVDLDKYLPQICLWQM
ncbi:MAG: hypothetical protein OEV74_15345 [Cyclobacteriaceae bacterium]|nr:hypothetical protein [Cyclobacteriaceae bacterium]MDH4297652.1 hypothetical protein [Cyclobacteriaceae bacterium]MDH5248237.1 hypothetical protein [Cyclobacteriaceae bacterium]